MNLSAADDYFRQAMSRLQVLLDSQREALDLAAEICTGAIAADGLVLTTISSRSRPLTNSMTR